MKYPYIALGIALAYTFHRMMKLYNGYRYMGDKYHNTFGRIKISVKYYNKHGVGQK